MSFLKSLTSNSRVEEQKKSNLTAAIALGASIAVTVIGVACLTAFYTKTLMDVNYIQENDIYEE